MYNKVNKAKDLAKKKAIEIDDKDLAMMDEIEMKMEEIMEWGFMSVGLGSRYCEYDQKQKSQKR